MSSDRICTFPVSWSEVVASAPQTSKMALSQWTYFPSEDAESDKAILPDVIGGQIQKNVPLFEGWPRDLLAHVQLVRRRRDSSDSDASSHSSASSILGRMGQHGPIDKDESDGSLSGRSSTTSSPTPLQLAVWSLRSEQGDSSGSEGYEDAVSELDDDFVDANGYCSRFCKCADLPADGEMDATLVKIAAAEPEEVAVPKSVEEVVPEKTPIVEEEKEFAFKTDEEKAEFEEELMLRIKRDWDPLPVKPDSDPKCFRLPSKCPVPITVPFDSVFKRTFPPLPEPAMSDFMPKDYSDDTPVTNTLNPSAPEFVPTFASKRKSTNKWEHFNSQAPPPSYEVPPPSSYDHWGQSQPIGFPTGPCEFFPGHGGYLAFMPFVDHVDQYY